MTPTGDAGADDTLVVTGIDVAKGEYLCHAADRDGVRPRSGGGRRSRPGRAGRAATSAVRRGPPRRGVRPGPGRPGVGRVGDRRPSRPRRRCEGPAAETAGPVVMDVVHDQLAQERAIKDSLETRANGVITSSGTLVTLPLAIVGLVAKSGELHLGIATKALIVAALAAFLAAAVLAMVAVRPRAYAAVNRADLEAISTERSWLAPGPYAGPRIASVLVGIIERSREMNRGKAAQLGWAIRAEAAAIVFVGLVAVVLVTR